VAFANAVRFLACCRDGFVRRTIHCDPAGQTAARLSRCDLGDVLVLLHGAVLVHNGLPRIRGKQSDPC